MDLLPIGLLCNIGQYNRWVFPNDPDLCIKNSKQLSRHAIKNDNIVHLEFLTKAIMKIKRCKKCIKSLTLLAARYGSFDCLQWLIDHDFHKHPLSILEGLKYCYSNNNMQIVQLLIESGFKRTVEAAKLIIEHKDAGSLASLLKQEYIEDDYLSVDDLGYLLFCCRNIKFIEGIKVILVHDCHEASLLVQAIIYNDLNLLKMLVEIGIDTPRRFSVLGLAILFEREECIKLLIDAGYECQYLLLEYAAIINYRPGLKLLLAPINDISFELAAIARIHCPELFEIILEFSPKLQLQFNTNKYIL